jgi:hypothetical protein
MAEWLRAIEEQELERLAAYCAATLAKRLDYGFQLGIGL